MKNRPFPSKEVAWWHVPIPFLSSLREIESRMNMAVMSKERLTKKDLLKSFTPPSNVDPLKVIDFFIEYYRHCNEYVGQSILSEFSNPISFSFSVQSNLFRDYRPQLEIAHILLNRIISSYPKIVLQTDLYEALHSVINDNRYKPSDHYGQREKEKAISSLYRDRFRGGMKFLLNENFVRKTKEKKRKIANNRHISKDGDAEGYLLPTYEYVTHEDIFHSKVFTHINEAELTEFRKKLLLGATQRLYRRHLANVHQSAPTLNRTKGKIKAQQGDIEKLLENINIENTSDRTFYLWYKAFLLLRVAIKDTRFLVDNFGCYIQYSNILFALTPVKDGELYPWIDGYECWKRFFECIEKITKIKVKYPTTIDDMNFKDACKMLNTSISDLFGNEDISETNFALKYIQATIESNIHHKDAVHHLEELFKFATSHSYPCREYDLCLIIFKLTQLTISDPIEFPIKAKKWLFALNNLTKKLDNQTSFYDIESTKINIYIHLIGLTPNENKPDKLNRYIRQCVTLIDAVTPNGYNQELEYLSQKYLFLLYAHEELPYPVVAQRIVSLWDELVSISHRNPFVKSSQFANELDPRVSVLKSDLFLLASSILKDYLEFGYSLPILAATSYLELKNIGIKERLTFFYLLNGLSSFLESIDETLSIRLLITQEKYYEGKSHINRIIAKTLFEKGYIIQGLEYAQKAISQFGVNNFANIDELCNFIDAQLMTVKPLFLLGRNEEARNILKESSKHIEELYNLFDINDRNVNIQGVIEIFEEIENEIRKRPFFEKELRLDYIITHISHQEIEDVRVLDFYEKWKQFNLGYMFHKEELNESLINEFESDSFSSLLEDIAATIEIIHPEPCLDLVNDEEISQLKDKLLEAYETYQGFFIVNEDDEFSLPNPSNIDYPSMAQLFDIFRGPQGVDEFLKHLTSFDNDNELEQSIFIRKCHYIITNDHISREDIIKTAELCIPLLNKIQLSDSIRMMAAEIYSILADIKWNDFDECMKLLYRAQDFLIFNTTILKTNYIAKIIYIHICRQLSDVYNYQQRDSHVVDCCRDAISFFLESQLEPSVDIARIYGNLADKLTYTELTGIRNIPEAKLLLNTAIEILRQILPVTEDSEHYLSVFIEDLKILENSYS